MTQPQLSDTDRAVLRTLGDTPRTMREVCNSLPHSSATITATLAYARAHGIITATLTHPEEGCASVVYVRAEHPMWEEIDRQPTAPRPKLAPHPTTTPATPSAASTCTYPARPGEFVNTLATALDVSPFWVVPAVHAFGRWIGRHLPFWTHADMARAKGWLKTERPDTVSDTVQRLRTQRTGGRQ